jgi:hypothetical protein
MKFYVAAAPDGRTVLCGTQADAKKINKTFEEFEVPVDKTGLMEFAQSALDRIFSLEQQLAAGGGADPLSQAPSAPAEEPAPWEEPATLDKAYVPDRWTAGQIEDYLLNVATVAQCEQVFTCLGNRFGMLAKNATLETEATPGT